MTTHPPLARKYHAEGSVNPRLHKTGVTSTQALLGYNSAIDTYTNCETVNFDVIKIRENVVKTIENAQQREKFNFDKKRKDAIKYKVNNFV